MKGAYILCVEVSSGVEVCVGGLGSVFFDKGFYAYVGSAMRGFDARIFRYLCGFNKRRWHIDYLLENSEVRFIHLYPSESRRECVIAGEMMKYFSYVEGFGCSDCRCRSHLFYSRDVEDLRVFAQII